MSLGATLQEPLCLVIVNTPSYALRIYNYQPVLKEEKVYERIKPILK